MKKFFNQFLFYLVLIILLYPASLVKADTTSIEGNNYLEGQESNYLANYVGKYYSGLWRCKQYQFTDCDHSW